MFMYVLIEKIMMNIIKTKNDMKKILIETLIMVSTGVISGIGFIALTIALDMGLNNFYIFIPFILVSWIILYPSYKFWSDIFKKILNYEKYNQKD